MYTKTKSTILFTSLLSTASAFVPFRIDPLPADLDTRIWSPWTTITPTTVTAAPSEHITAAPTPTTVTEEEILNIQPVLDPNMIPDLRPRQAVTQAVAPVVTQVSPITTYQINLYRGGTVSQLNVVYTQTFNPIPDQWPSPTLVGTIGLGTIQGEIGVVKTKRSLPTQAPLASDRENDDKDLIPMMNKLKKAGYQLTDEIVSLVHKMKKPTFQEIEDEIIAMAKSIRLPASKDEVVGSLKATERYDMSHAENEQDDTELSQLSPELHIVENKANLMESGMFPMLAIAAGVLMFSWF